MSWDQIQGWVDGDLLSLYDAAIAAAQDGDTLVEIGVAYGKSLAYLAHRSIAANKTLNLIGIDIWEGNTPDTGPNNLFIKQEQCVAEMQLHAPDEFKLVRLVKDDSIHATTAFFGVTHPSFVFIDGNHAYAAVLADITAWAPLVKTGGVIAGHDRSVNYPGVEQAVAEYFKGQYDKVGTCWRKQL